MVVATGAYETQFLFANNDLPGVMLSTAVLRLIHHHAIVPGKRAVLIGDATRCAELQADLEAAGVEVVASLPIELRRQRHGDGSCSPEWQPKQLPMTRTW